MSSLFAALGVAVSGLGAQSQAIGNISDDLANAQTTGYKSIGTSFSSMVTASSATNNSPGGVSAKPSYRNDVQGNINSSETTTNLAISGQGFFNVTTMVRDENGTAQPTESQFYTRDGSFTLNSDGYLVNSSGYYLEGYAVSNGIASDELAPIQISSMLGDPQQTTALTYIANLPAGASDFTSTASTINIYDALGDTHQTSVVWETTATTNVWKATVTVADAGGDDGTGTHTNLSYKASFEVTFNSSAPTGTIQSIDGAAEGCTSGYYDASGNIVADLGPVETTAAVAGNAAIVTLGGLAADTTTSNLIFPGSAPQTVSLDLGNFNQATGLTQYANATTAVSVSSIAQDGLPKGSYSSIGIDSDGIISINYTNGSTRNIYQIPVATFNSPDNLQRVSGGVYTATLGSGTAQLRTAGSNGAGTFSSSALESSTVDIASEFTTMIQSQQVYSANAKVVSTVNSMLNTIIQAVQ
ncbi:MAG: flagellar hook protein FlgE [Alphaproteobacteria bacterium]|nr:flagellar hook protein FlgE [Alphaproteobacteria bacterium]